ncbi:MAG: phenylalanine--tRNA ligase subunit alpha [candidate division Zixibacteria bacterium]|nr:phenylalanine--tRNA ligase subunit alpha [candidate division Zixibacteria bacterium]
MAFLTKLKEIEKLIESRLNSVSSPKEFEELESEYFNRKGKFSLLMKELKDLPPDLRPEAGEKANILKRKLNGLFQEKALSFREKKVAGGLVDFSLPGHRSWEGKLHPLTQVLEGIVEIFCGMGFEVVGGPDIETNYYNFDALNFPRDHPARDMQDTFYLGRDLVLRTHTSPVQVRVFEKRKPPVKILAPGRVYRHEAINSRSYCLFYQVEGFYVDENVTFADLKGILITFAREFFGKEIELRFRASFFPFTEPSAEVDIRCIICKGKGCGLCKHRGWLEILGAGMIDPAVFEAVGYDPERYSGYAFGMGVDRIALLKYGIDDIRLFYENDIRFLRQF